MRTGEFTVQPDVVISSAMDLQVALVNREMARHIYLSAATTPPDWANWRSELFGFCCTSEMFDATARGDLILAINTIGSYAAA